MIRLVYKYVGINIAVSIPADSVRSARTRFLPELKHPNKLIVYTVYFRTYQSHFILLDIF